MLFAFSAALWYLATRGGSWLGVWEMPQSCFGPALAIVILVVNFLDRQNFRQRDIFHWAGIVAFVANVGLMFVYRMIVIGI